MSLPKRIQRKRTKGYRHPPNTKYVGRPGKWANPYAVQEDGFGKWLVVATIDKSILASNISTKKIALGMSIAFYKGRIKRRGYPGIIELLDYKHLSCWCPLDQRCHVDALIELIKEY